MRAAANALHPAQSLRTRVAVVPIAAADAHAPLLASFASQEEYDIVGGVFDGQMLDKKGVIQITKLPTKQELMGQTAMLIKQLPTKLARSLNNAGAQRLAKVTKQASGQKLVQAVKAMEGKLE